MCSLLISHYYKTEWFQVNFTILHSLENFEMIFLINKGKSQIFDWKYFDLRKRLSTPSTWGVRNRIEKLSGYILKDFGQTNGSGCPRSCSTRWPDYDNINRWNSMPNKRIWCTYTPSPQWSQTMRKDVSKRPRSFANNTTLYIAPESPPTLVV